jgi:hypothetical protein
MAGTACRDTTWVTRFPLTPHRCGYMRSCESKALTAFKGVKVKGAQILMDGTDLTVTVRTVTVGIPVGVPLCEWQPGSWRKH